ncbi:hypothetical protein K492DRAFT_174101 [Lichtheimia hyalospora FSU 10163]|nr:hypothetical protein K492DRAFT_174101 [Lichtheimia hyalospora FSU 10163]
MLELPEIDFINILVNIGIVIGGALLFPIVFTIVLVLLGFTTAGILGGSAAALTMSCLHPVQSGGIFAGLQSLGAIGLFGIIVNPCMLLLEVIVGAAITVHLWIVYSFDMSLFWNDWSDVIHGVMHNVAMAFNYGLSIVANMFGGALAGMFAGYLISCCWGVIQSVCCSGRSIQLPIYHSNSGSEFSTTEKITLLFTFIGIVIGVVLAIKFPYNIIPL